MLIKFPFETFIYISTEITLLHKTEEQSIPSTIKSFNYNSCVCLFTKDVKMVRTYKCKIGSMMCLDYTDETMENCLVAIRSKESSQRAASKNYNIPAVHLSTN